VAFFDSRCFCADETDILESLNKLIILYVDTSNSFQTITQLTSMSFQNYQDVISASGSDISYFIQHLCRKHESNDAMHLGPHKL
jgi:hypothetical protein